jgi:hypothetical protein
MVMENQLSWFRAHSNSPRLKTTLNKFIELLTLGIATPTGLV